MNLEGYDISFYYHEQHISIVYDIKPEGTRVMLSQYLNSFLGLNQHWFFTGTGEISLRASAPAFHSEIKDIELKSSNILFVNSDIVSLSFYGGNQLSYMAVIDRPGDGNNEIVYRPTQRVFKPLVEQCISQLRISIKDEVGDFIPKTEILWA